MIPLIIFASLKVGGFFVEEKAPIFSENKLTFEAVKNHLVQYLIGSTILAIITAIFLGGLSYFLLIIFTSKKEK